MSRKEPPFNAKNAPRRAAKERKGTGAFTFPRYSLDTALALLAFFMAGKPAAAFERSRRRPAGRETRFLRAAWTLAKRGVDRELAAFQSRLVREDEADLPARLEDIIDFPGRPAEMPAQWRTIRVAQALSLAAHAALDAATPPTRQVANKAVALACRAVQIAMNLDGTYPYGANEFTLTVAKVELAAVLRRGGEFSTALEALDDATATVLYNAAPAYFDEHACDDGENCDCSLPAELITVAMTSPEGVMILMEQARLLHEMGRTNEALEDVASALEILKCLDDEPGIAACTELRDSIFNRRFTGDSQTAEGGERC